MRFDPLVFCMIVLFSVAVGEPGIGFFFAAIYLLLAD